MTQEQKDILLKDLCSRLPYGVKFKYEDRPNVCEILSITPIYNNGNVVYFDRYVNEPKKCSIYDVKPYLFPLSSMTEEQKKDIFHNGKFYIDRRNSLCRFPMYEDDYDFVTMEDCLEIFNKLNRYHFDYRGLIPMGMAIDATGKNIY